MSYFCQLNGTPCQRAYINFPFAGFWHADVKLVNTVDVTGPQTLIFGGLTLTCAVYRAINFAGARGIRLIGGNGAWRNQIPPLYYQNPGGVLASLVLSDAATACGELAPAVAPDFVVGTSYTRSAVRASTTLNDVLGNTWWLSNGGQVQNATRPSPAIVSEFIPTQVRGAAGLYTIATEVPEDWVPGATFVGPTVSGTISRVMFQVEGIAVRTEVLAA